MGKSCVRAMSERKNTHIGGSNTTKRGEPNITPLPALKPATHIRKQRKEIQTDTQTDRQTDREIGKKEQMHSGAVADVVAESPDGNPSGCIEYPI